jgi:hypothetical protein
VNDLVLVRLKKKKKTVEGNIQHWLPALTRASIHTVGFS